GGAYCLRRPRARCSDAHAETPRARAGPRPRSPWQTGRLATRLAPGCPDRPDPAGPRRVVRAVTRHAATGTAHARSVAHHGHAGRTGGRRSMLRAPKSDVIWPTAYSRAPAQPP